MFRPMSFNALSLLLSLLYVVVLEYFATSIRTRQIIRYRATANLQRPQIKHNTASKWGGGVQNQRRHHIILTKYIAVHPTAVSENKSCSGMLIGQRKVTHYVDFHWLEICRVRGAVIKNVRRPLIG